MPSPLGACCHSGGPLQKQQKDRNRFLTHLRIQMWPDTYSLSPSCDTSDKASSCCWLGKRTHRHVRQSFSVVLCLTSRAVRWRTHSVKSERYVWSAHMHPASAVPGHCQTDVHGDGCHVLAATVSLDCPPELSIICDMVRAFCLFLLLPVSLQALFLHVCMSAYVCARPCVSLPLFFLHSS